MDVRKVPYRLTELTEATAAGHSVLILEGEKDVNAAWRTGSARNMQPQWRGQMA